MIVYYQCLSCIGASAHSATSSPTVISNISTYEVMVVTAHVNTRRQSASGVARSLFSFLYFFGQQKGTSEHVSFF